MMKMEKTATDLKTYIKLNLAENSTIGIDLNFFSICILILLLASYKRLVDFLKNHKITPDNENIIDEIWNKESQIFMNKVIIHELKYSGESCLEKYERVKGKIPFDKFEGKKNVAILITKMDDIACINNLY